METPASNRLGLAEPVSRTEGNKPSPSTVLGDARQEYTPPPGMAGPAGRSRPDIPAGSTPSSSSWPKTPASIQAPRSRSARSAAMVAGRSACTRTSICSILFEHPMSSSDERFVGSLLQPLWDLGLTVGQHVREPPEIVDATALDMGNAEFLLALLDVRLHRRRRAAVSAAGGLGPAVSAPTTGGACSTRCCSSSTSATRRSTTPSISSSRTSRALPAGCATSRRRAHPAAAPGGDR